MIVPASGDEDEVERLVEHQNARRAEHDRQRRRRAWCGTGCSRSHASDRAAVHRSTSDHRRLATLTSTDVTSEMLMYTVIVRQNDRHGRRTVADRRLGHQRQVVVPDRGAERGVLDQVEVLVADRRDRDSERLREDDVPHSLEPAERDRVGGLPLARAGPPGSSRARSRRCGSRCRSRARRRARRTTGRS